ncbi:ubiquitin, partial [Setomelanomma holmii]
LIKCPVGVTKSFSVHSDRTIQAFKQIIQRSEVIHPDRQRLFFAQWQLADVRTLGDYDISRECTIHVVLRFGGGGFQIPEPKMRGTLS